jgi:hypothetical protein
VHNIDGACTQDSDCGNLTCNQAAGVCCTPNPVQSSCSGLPSCCQQDADCCYTSGFCQSGQCCSGSGGPCTNSILDCCNGFNCNHGVCQ